MVTYVVLTYNQESYIREAVQSALAQNYSPLEVIVSDDCSIDKTFDVIREIYLNKVGNPPALPGRQ